MAENGTPKAPRGPAKPGAKGAPKGGEKATRPTRPRRSWGRRLLRASVVLASALVAIGSIAGLAGLVWYQRNVIANPGAHLDRAHIEAIIAEESPVYYRDGTTRVGVFFEDEHRMYVSWDELPPAYVLSIVAAEDGGFWTHPGVSPKHIVRALLDNAAAGEVVAGGSTLTQQTAKNLYYRPDRSLKSKLTELLNALRLEAHYDKTDILVFYTNQFHVSGNGRGVGIAARYFFDKEPDELTLEECAFLAGLVKAPAWYDPFLGDEERRATAVSRAHERTRYVLQRLLDEPTDNLAAGPIPGKPGASQGDREVALEVTRAEARRLLDEGFTLKFRRGTFRYDSSALLDEVARRLHEPPFDAVLAEAGIEDPATAGLVVVTTLDPDIEREAIYALWHHLTEVGTLLEGHTADDFLRPDGKGPRFAPEHLPRKHEFRLAEITKVIDPVGQPHFEVDLGGSTCTVDRDAVIRAALWSHRGATGDRDAKVPTAKVNEFAGQLPKGGIVWVSVREVAPDGSATCDLELRPELQGAVMVVEDGQIRAMVGGNDNRNFNRSTALRQMGSTWKPLVYHAAMKLGWLPTDDLDNDRNVFPFSTTYYFPSPDHPPAPVVSMSWAGVNSENLASIWLLYHLTDALDAEQIRVMAETLDMARRPDESPTDYRTRVQKMGVLPTASRLEEGYFLQARQEVLSSLETGPHPEDELPLRSLLYGWGFEGERARVASQSPSERAWKTRALDNSWVRVRDLLAPCATQHEVLSIAVARGQIPDRASVPDLTVLVGADRVDVACGAVPSGYVGVAEGLDDLLAAGGADGSGGTAVPRPLGKPSSRGGRFGGLFGTAPEPDVGRVGGLPVAPRSDMLVDDRLHYGTLEAIDQSMLRRRTARRAMGEQAPGLYDPEVLYWHQDFRVLLGLKYVTAMAAEYGVRTDVQEVLALPLGASEITLEEAVMVYEGITTGETWTFPGTSDKPGSAGFVSPADPTLLIAEIRDVDGRVLYRAEPKSERRAPAEVGAMTADILSNVVEHGTGRRAAELIEVGGGFVPLGGKTGTTNDYRNAAFFGFVPVARGDAWSVPDGYTVGVYVGYDDNTPLTKGRIRLAGSNGALPAWNLVAQGIAEAGLLGEPRGAPPEGRRWPLAWPPGMIESVVETATGRPLDPAAPASDTATVLTTRPAPSRVAEVDLEFAPRRFPFRVAPRTEDAQRLEELRRKQEERKRDKPSIWDVP